MSRILFQPKSRLLIRSMLAFALVLAIQAGFSGYLFFTAMERLTQTNIEGKLLHVASLAANDPLVEKSLNVRSDDRDADKILSGLSGFLSGLAPMVDVRGAYLFRVDGARIIYLAGSRTANADGSLPTPHITNLDMNNLNAGRTVISKPFRVSGRQLMKAVYVPILRNHRLAGLLAIEDDAQDIELLTILKRQLLFTAAGAFLIVGLVSYLLAGAIVRPVRDLVRAADELGRGKFSTRFKVTGNDELNFLGQTFNDMAEDIEARDEQIRRMNEAALADARQLYEHVLRAAYAAILTANNDDLLTSENPAAAAILGDCPAGLVRMADRLAPYPELLALWQGTKPAQNQELILARDGVERVVEATIAALTDHRNEQIGHSLTLVDRTDIKNLERQLVMRERLAALGELAAGIAHEIRNPLNGIELMLGLVQEDLVEKGFRDERFFRIHGEVTRLNSILNDFLLFARPKPQEKESADLLELIDDAVMLLAPLIEEKNIAVVRRFAAPLPPILLETGAIRRLFINLIKNACEAMPVGGCLTLAVQPSPAGTNELLIEVRDNGPGIAPEVRDRLFNPFVTTKDEGTGLGLAIVHKTIVNHGGSIDCHNHPEGGACFTIKLPQVEVH